MRGAWSTEWSQTNARPLRKAPADSTYIVPCDCAQLVAGLARVLRLDYDQRAYLYELAGRPMRARASSPQKVQPQKQRMLDQLTDVPAMVARLESDGRRADARLRNDRRTGAQLRAPRVHPSRDADVVRAWESVAWLCVAQSAEFREWWDAHLVASKGTTCSGTSKSSAYSPSIPPRAVWQRSRSCGFPRDCSVAPDLLGKTEHGRSTPRRTTRRYRGDSPARVHNVVRPSRVTAHGNIRTM
jgi:hypothetical protein